MTALQKAFSRHEKVERMLSNLEEMKKGGEVDEARHAELKSQYEALLAKALENLKEIRTKIKAQKDQASQQLEALNTELGTIEVRGKTGELGPEQVAKTMTAIQGKRDHCQRSVLQFDALLLARSSTDVGGYLDVDVAQEIEYRDEWRADWQGVQGVVDDVAQKVKALGGGNIAQSLSSAAEKVYDKASTTRKGPLPRGAGVYVAVGAVLLVLLVAGWRLVSSPAKPGKLNERIIEQVILRDWQKAPPLFKTSISDRALIEECALAGLVIATDPQMRNYGVADGMGHLASWDGHRLQLHFARGGEITISRFTPPADARGMTVSHIEYTYSWEPTELLTDPEYQSLREAMRKQLVDIERNVKLPVSASADLGFFSDGWAILQ